MPDITMIAETIIAAHRQPLVHEAPDCRSGRSTSTYSAIWVATIDAATHSTADEKASSHNPHPTPAPTGMPKKFAFGMVMILMRNGTA